MCCYLQLVKIYLGRPFISGFFCFEEGRLGTIVLGQRKTYSTVLYFLKKTPDNIAGPCQEKKEEGSDFARFWPSKKRGGRRLRWTTPQLKIAQRPQREW
jgi:hypothetical protein